MREVRATTTVGIRAEELLDIARALAGAQSRQEIVAIAMGLVFDVVGADGGVAYQLSKQGDLELIGVRGVEPVPAQRLPLDLDVPTAACARLGEAIFLADRTELVRRFPLLESMLRPPNAHRQAAVAMPLHSGDELVGVITYGFDRPLRLDREERAFYLTIKSHASVAIERAYLRAAEGAARARLEMIAHASKRFSEAGFQVTSVCTIVAEQLATWLRGTAAINLLDNHRERLDLATIHDVDADRLASVRTTMEAAPVMLDGPSMLAQVAKTGDALFVREVDMAALVDAIPVPAYRAHFARHPIRSIAVVPLRVRSEILGTLTVSMPLDGRALEPEDVAMLTDLAERAGLAVQNARLHEEARRAVQAREDMLAVVSHDLRTPIQGFEIGLGVLAERYRATQHAPNVVASMHLALTRMGSLIRKLMDLAQIDSGALRVEQDRIDVRSITDEMLAVHGPLAAERTITLEVDISSHEIAVRGSRDLLLQVFDNLLANAIKFTPSGGRVTLASRPVGDQIEFAVTDTGPGIAPEHIPHLFERYWQATRRPKQGVGLGLAISHGIVAAHGGRMWVVSEQGKGAMFCFTLPRAA